jgi:hypothetical protein
MGVMPTLGRPDGRWPARPAVIQRCTVHYTLHDAPEFSIGLA